MKTLTKLFSILFLTLAIVTFTGCGDESTDPVPAKSDLVEIQEGLIGATLSFVKGEVTDGTEPLQTITNGCIGGKYAISLDDFDLIFNTNSEVRFKSNCDQYFDFIKYYKITEISSTEFSFILYNNSNFTVPYVNGVVKSTDILNGDGSIKDEIKIKFNEITNPAKNWQYSPTIYFKYQ